VHAYRRIKSGLPRIRAARSLLGDSSRAARVASLSVEPKVVDQLSKLAARTGEPKTRIATRLFTDAVMSYKPASPKAKNGAR